MAEYEYLNAVTGQETKLTFSDFVTLVKGASITSLAASDDFGFIEFGLSDAINLRITNGNKVTLMPTTNEGDEAPVRLSLIAGDETPTAKLVESRIHALRQVYAIDFLLNADRESEISVMLSGDGPYDIESLLNDDDKLLIKSASTGSFWLTLAAKSSAAWSSLKGIAPLFFDEGRQAVIQRVKANTELVKLDVDKKQFDVTAHRVHGFIDIYNKLEKIKDPDDKKRLKAELLGSLEKTGTITPSLPAPDKANNGKV